MHPYSPTLYSCIGLPSDFVRKGLSLREVERKLDIAERLAGCLHDHRASEKLRHTVAEMIRFRMFAIAAGYEDANDCDTLRRFLEGNLFVVSEANVASWLTSEVPAMPEVGPVYPQVRTLRVAVPMVRT